MLLFLTAWALGVAQADPPAPAQDPPVPPAVVEEAPAEEGQPAAEEAAPAAETGAAQPAAEEAATAVEAAAMQSAAEEIRATEVQPESAAAEVAPAPAATDEAVWVLQTSRDQSSDANRSWRLSGSYEFRSLAVTDTDPLNTMYGMWRARGDVDLFPGGRVFLRLGLLQSFSAEEGESGFLLQDTLLGLNYGHQIELDFVPLPYFKGRKLDLEHRFGLFLPTSRASMNQDLYVAPYLLSSLRYGALASLIVSVDGWFRYHFHRYAERQGPGGGLNTQLDFGASLGVEYTAYEHDEWGSVSVGADLSTSYDKTFASAEEYSAPQSSQSFWNQDYGWDLYATYTPLSYLTVVLGIEQGGRVLRDGVVNMFVAHRDETEVFVQLLGRY